MKALLSITKNANTFFTYLTDPTQFRVIAKLTPNSRFDGKDFSGFVRGNPSELLGIIWSVLHLNEVLSDRTTI